MFSNVPSKILMGNSVEDLDHLLYYPIFVSLRRKFIFDILVQVIEADDVMKIKLKLCIRNNRVHHVNVYFVDK